MLRSAIPATANELAWLLAPRTMERRIAPQPSRGSAQTALRVGVIIVHIPKTGGISIGHALYGRSPSHRTWLEWREALPNDFNNLLKIAVVRDPVDRFLSAYDYLISGGRNEMDARFGARYLKPSGDINALAHRIQSRPMFRNRIMSFCHFRPQVEFIGSDAGEVMVNHLIPFERMGELVPSIVGVDVQHINRTVGKRTTDADLSPEARSTIKALYRADFALHAFASTSSGDVFGKQFR